MKRLLYRYLRNDMVARMRSEGFSWAKINTVMQVLGQKIVTHYYLTPDGIRIIFNKPKTKLVKEQNENKKQK